MTAAAYISSLPTAAERSAAADRWYEWHMWAMDGEQDNEAPMVLYLSVLAQVELGEYEYAEEEIEDYRLAALAALAEEK